MGMSLHYWSRKCTLYTCEYSNNHKECIEGTCTCVDVFRAPILLVMQPLVLCVRLVMLAPLQPWTFLCHAPKALMLKSHSQ